MAPDVGGSNPLTHPKLILDRPTVPGRVPPRLRASARRPSPRTSTGIPGVKAAVVEREGLRRVVLQVVLTTVVFAVLDFLWLGVFMNGFYKTELGTMARLSGSNFAPVWWAAFAVYAVLVIGLVVFVLPRSHGAPARALGFGALLGVVTYGTYDFTAYSVIAGWSLRMTLVDLAWGAVICGVSAAIVTALEPRLVRPSSAPARARQSLV